MSYFESFPRTTYAGKECLDLTRRVGLRRLVSGDAKTFQTYTVPSGQRADQVAEGYYGDPQREWIVYLSTGVIDPYFQWALSDEAFSEMIASRYGSIEAAAETIVYWQSNWRTGRSITPEDYSALPEDQKRYYEPVLSEVTEAIEYRRRRDDTRVATNMIARIDLAPGSNSFSSGERVEIRSVSDGTFWGESVVASTGEETLTIKHVGAVPTQTDRVVSIATGRSRDVLGATVVARSIPATDTDFWEPVTALAHEVEMNDERRRIRLVDSRFVQKMEDELSTLLLGRSPV